MLFPCNIFRIFLFLFSKSLKLSSNIFEFIILQIYNANYIKYYHILKYTKKHISDLCMNNYISLINRYSFKTMGTFKNIIKA
jgi:hypothetical protein